MKNAMPIGNDEQEKLMQLVRLALTRDQELRDQYKMGEKFRFIHDRLQALFSRVEESLASQKKEETRKGSGPLEDETKVFIYLYNAQGTVLKSWQKMLNPGVFYEYSVNRPVYADKSSVEAFIRTRSNKLQHGFLTIIIKKQHILSTQEALKDALGEPLIRVKEGSFHLSKLISLTHNGVNYVLDSEGGLISDHSEH